MWPALFHALRIGGQVALGYFANDAATAAGKITGVKTSSDGKPPIWFVLVVFVVLGGAFYLLLKAIRPNSKTSI